MVTLQHTTTEVLISYKYGTPCSPNRWASSGGGTLKCWCHTGTAHPAHLNVVLPQRRHTETDVIQVQETKLTLQIYFLWQRHTETEVLMSFRYGTQANLTDALAPAEAAHRDWSADVIQVWDTSSPYRCTRFCSGGTQRLKCWCHSGMGHPANLTDVLPQRRHIKDWSADIIQVRHIQLTLRMYSLRRWYTETEVLMSYKYGSPNSPYIKTRSNSGAKRMKCWCNTGMAHPAHLIVVLPPSAAHRDRNTDMMQVRHTQLTLQIYSLRRRHTETEMLMSYRYGTTSSTYGCTPSGESKQRLSKCW